MSLAFADIAFTHSVRSEQARFGSAASYDRLLSDDRSGGADLTPREAAFLEARDGVFQATVSETGWPYVQFRGGRPGFLKVIGPRTIGYADYRGNRQYISAGNLRDSDRISLIAVDYARGQRLKLWGHARISEDPELMDRLNLPDGPVAERAIVIRVAAFDWNCPCHIPARRTDEEHGQEIAALKARIHDLEHQLAEAGRSPI